MEYATIAISAISLVIAILSWANSIKSQRLQNKVNEMELKLKDIELKEKETQLKKEPCVEARINHVSKGSYRIRVWNSGSAIAKNVSVSWDKTFGVLLIDNEKMPFEFLDPQKSFDLSVSLYDGSPGKLCIITSWEDEAGVEHSKKQWCSF